MILENQLMVQVVHKSRKFHLMIFIHVLFLDPLNPIEPLLDNPIVLMVMIIRRPLLDRITQ